MKESHDAADWPPERAVGWIRALRGSGQRLRLSTRGISMEPLLTGDSTVEIELSPPEILVPGDIFLFERHGRLILHRLIGIAARDGKPVLIEKGDHQLAHGTVDPADYLGRLCAAYTPAGELIVGIPTNKRLTPWLLRLARMEHGAYQCKQKWFGRRPMPLARPIRALGKWIRRRLMKHACRDPLG